MAVLDKAIKDATALSIDTLQRWLYEIRLQPAWRKNADKEADYYDGNQLDPQTVETMQERGLAPLVTNLIKPTIDVVLGMEAKSRTDWKVRPEPGEANTDVAEALSCKLHQAETESRADRACSDAYAQAVKVGIGWVEIARNADPFKAQYRVKPIHRREIFWDWRSKEPDLSDARYLVRRQWMDADILMQAYPEKAELLNQVFLGWQNWDNQLSFGTEMMRDWEIQRGFSVEQFEWLSTERRRITVYEVWYRVLADGLVIKLPNGNTEELDKNNPMHIAAAEAGAVIVKAKFSRVRVAMYAGPHLLSDQPSPYRHKHFPYVPFFGYREDQTGIPYGLIRTMLSPQDEINARKSKMMWLLSARRVVADDDAVEDHSKAASEVARPDAYILLNSKRKPNSQFSIEEPTALNAQQFQVMEEAKKEINQTAGIYQTLMGSDSQAKSGLAIAGLVEQGTTTLGEINDNAAFARRLVGEQLLELVKEDLEGKLNEPVVIEEEGRKPVTVILNVPTQAPDGGMMLQNDVSRVCCAVVLGDVPSSPTYRNQQLSQLAEIIKSLAPQIQLAVLDYFVEATDHPKRYEMAKRIRKLSGMQEGDGDPEKQQMVQQIQQLQAQLQQAIEGPQAAEIQAKIEKLKADTALSQARAVEIVDKVASPKPDPDESTEAQEGRQPSEETHES